ncbi:MAG: hypothetical protein ABIJ96_06815 [Elusimicrobiota bacterium]
MFDYKLKGKQVILQLDPEFLPHLKYCGIEGSPLFAKVYKMEQDGLWLETNSFRVCPTPIIKLSGPKGEQFCRAHIYIPRQAIISVVAFPAVTANLENDPKLHQIGFRPKSPIMKGAAPRAK